MEELGAWPLRVAWVLLALVANGPFADTLGEHSTPVVLTAVIGLWAGWTAALVAMLVSRDVALTALRLLVSGGLVATVWAVALGGDVDIVDAAAIVLAGVAWVWALMPWIGETWVDGSSYGPELRLPLRPPVLLGYLVVPVTGALILVGASTGPLLLAARQWVTGGLALVAGWAVVAVGARSLHQLSRRWIVLVPAGLVIHDPLTMPDPQLVLRRMVSRLGPAPADTIADDLTAGAAGLALQLDLREPVDLLVRVRGREAETRSSSSLLFTPSRPGRLLAAAAQRRLPVG